MEAQFHRIVSGKDARLFSRVARPMLAAAAVPYRIAVAARNRLYGAGALAVHRFATPIVSVGNITLGGTGKTPFVEYLCRWFLKRGKRPVILSRGYRSDGAINDEAELLRANLPDVPHLQGLDRVALARRAIAEYCPDVLVLDDGFQHRRLARELDIVLLDSTEPFGYGRLFPRGLLREPIASLNRANLIVLTRADLCTPDAVLQIRKQVSAAAMARPVVLAAHRPTAVRSSDRTSYPVGMLSNQPVVAFCGIGNASAFWSTLERIGCRVLKVRQFPDHHHYSHRDLSDLAAWASDRAGSYVVTTQKDHVKIAAKELGGVPLVSLNIEVEIDDPGGELDRALSRVVLIDQHMRQAA
jgi:tetraacyldisaccharide 4'-kinase